MRKVYFIKEDFEMFHSDITPLDFEFFRSHAGAFKRMWNDQSRKFMKIFVDTFENFIWKYGVMKDFVLKADEIDICVEEIMYYIRQQFVDGKATKARALLMNCVVATQQRHCVALMDKAPYSQNPFYMKETRETFRELFGLPDHKRAYLKVICGLPVYIKFAGAAVQLLRRWMDAEEIDSDDEASVREYVTNILTPPPKRSITHHRERQDERLQRLLEERWKPRADISHAKLEAAAADSHVTSGDSHVTDGDKQKKKRKKKKKVASTEEEQKTPSKVKTSTEQEILVPSSEPADKDPASATACRTDQNSLVEEGVEPVAEEAGAVARDESTVKKKLHLCAFCSVEEQVAKTFKRCQRCRGKTNPKYYCSRDCQVKDWKTHRLDHKD